MPPQIYPTKWCDLRPLRDAEHRVYDALAAQLGDKFMVIHDMAWIARRSSGRAPFLQADFVIAHPGLGVIVLEVKGGQRIWCEKGIWFCRRKDGNEFAYKLPPHQQAQ